VEGLRRVGDRFSLVIPLNTSSVQAPSTPDFSIEYAQFEISKGVSLHNHRGGGLGGVSGLGGFGRVGGFHNLPQTTSPSNHFLKIQAQEVASVAVRHGYTTGSAQWRAYLTERLRRWAWLELYKMKPENRPFQPPNVHPLVSDLQEFELPQSWDYADDQIPQWYRDWELVSQEGRESTWVINKNI